MQNSSYLINTMARGEKVVTSAKLHGMAYFPPVFLLFLGLIGLIVGIELTPKMKIFALLDLSGVLFILVGAFGIWANKCREMVGTTNRVINKQGIFSVQTMELRNDRIESVSVDQTIWGRILGYGDVWFSGTGTTRVVFRMIANPLQTKIAFEELIEQSDSQHDAMI